MKSNSTKPENLRVLVLGNSGQLARALQEVSAEQECVVKTLGRPEYEFGLEENINPHIQSFKPDILINATAWTDVDGAEEDIKGAELGNYLAPKKMAELASKEDLPFIHVSTDYVFDGKSSSPYTEEDLTTPLNQYGRTKLMGEAAILQSNPRSIIARTAWLFSRYPGNFVTTILNAAKSRDTLRVTEDQIGNPTSTKALARILLSISKKAVKSWRDEYHGVFHVASPDQTDRLTFVREIIKSSEIADKPILSGIKTSEWPLPAERPLDTSLNTKKISDIFDLKLPKWRDQLHEVLLDRIENRR